jgi:hypothetical protein
MSSNSNLVKAAFMVIVTVKIIGLSLLLLFMGGWAALFGGFEIAAGLITAGVIVFIIGVVLLFLA